MSKKQEWKSELRIYLKAMAFTAVVLTAVLMAGLAFDAAFGDVGKVLYGGLCFWTGGVFMPWVVEKKPGWFK